jgi:hypothetical protein
MIRMQNLAAIVACGLALAGCGGGGKGGNTGTGGAPGGSGGEAATGSGGGTVAGSGGTTVAGSGGTTVTCSGGTTATGNGGAMATGNGSFEPPIMGATWTYATSDTDKDGGVADRTKTVSVEANEGVPGRTGVMAWRFHTVVPGDQDQLTWQADTETAIVRYRDDVYTAGSTASSALQSYSMYAPSKLRIDITPAHLVTGVTYTESFTETDVDATDGNASTTTAQTSAWKVIDAAESVTVPAGTFTSVHIQKLNGTSGAVDKDYWFVRGVGKVKETSHAGRTEVLSAYTIPPT